ncbi:hypothetical protein M989_01187 [Kluyvera georgiana ATCC 51603]|uniref:Uncharacterized protein n=1 Tax=Kluyvera georgiana ATCC 51603 TaxID=1354264 RepID=A0A1B7K541_9ENTR|nr:hypothetical protein [Kluyvera georgiana]OAT55270.1 hypothetical protein M989_01187 [Kluyvera georgiana ATCC 51603]
MGSTPDELRFHYHNMAAILVAAKAYFQVYESLDVERENKPNYYYTVADFDDSRLYDNHFKTVIDGMFKLIFIEISCLFEKIKDTNNDTFSLHRFKSLLKDIGRDDLVALIEDKLRPHEEVVLFSLAKRNKTIAHRDVKAFCPDSKIFDKYNITINHIKRLLCDISEVFKHIHIELWKSPDYDIFSSDIIANSTDYVLCSLNTQLKIDT